MWFLSVINFLARLLDSIRDMWSYKPYDADGVINVLYTNEPCPLCGTTKGGRLVYYNEYA